MRDPFTMVEATAAALLMGLAFGFLTGLLVLGGLS